MNTPKQVFTIHFILCFKVLCFSQSEDVEVPNELKRTDQRILTLLNELKAAELDRDTSKLISVTNDLMLRYSLMHHLERSHELSKTNLTIAKKWGDPCLLGQTLNRYGLVMANHLDYDKFSNLPREGFFRWADSTLFYFKSALKVGIPDEECVYNTETWAYIGLQMTHYFLARMSHQDFDTSLQYGDSAQTNAIRFEDQVAECDSYVWTARSYSLTAEYDIAKKYIKKALKLDQEINRGLVDIYDVWYGTLVKESGSDTLLWLHVEILNRMRNRAGEEMQAAIQDADRKYETEKKEQEILRQQESIKKREQIIGISVIGALTLGLLAIYLYTLSKKNKKLSQRNELLLKEQNHRVKNNLQMINSLLSLQSQKLLSTDAVAALSESQGRINSVALLHRMLYEGDELGMVDIKDYLKTLINEITYATPRKMELDLSVDDHLEISVEKATSLGLIVNELVTNSLKHVAEEIDLNIRFKMKNAGNELEIIYADNGGIFDIELWKTSRSFGKHLIRLQSEQLRGTYEVWSDQGFQYNIKIAV